MTTHDELLAELRTLLAEWDSLTATQKVRTLERVEREGYFRPAWRMPPTLPHIWVSDYPGGRPGLRWSQEQQDLPCYCKFCRTPHDRKLLNEECWARDTRTSRRVRYSA